ncbi:MAG: energy-coupling factor ABC transporter permease [Fusobacteriaceae bacterium]
MKKKFSLVIFLLTLFTVPTYSMHIAEGYLTFNWSIFWWVFYLPFFFYGLKKLKISAKTLEKKQVIALVAAFIFVVSAIKLPSVTGSSSHATGIALGAILLGPAGIFVIGAVVLFFQATFLAHGGYTTLGANAISMAVVGALIAYFLYKIFKNRGQEKVGIFLAAFIGNLATYSCTALQLTLSHGGENFMESFIKFMSLFAVTQIPLGIVEGIVSIILISILQKEEFMKTEEVMGNV